MAETTSPVTGPFSGITYLIPLTSSLALRCLKKENTMTDFQERVIAERKDLYDKCEKLNAFIANSPIFKTLPTDEQVRLRLQLLVMNQYATILAERIAEFLKVPDSTKTTFPYDEIDERCCELGAPEYVETDDGEALYWRFSGSEFPVADTLAELLLAARSRHRA